MKKTFLLMMLLFFGSIQAQITFEKGYFINNQGKRMECYIENIDWRNNPTSFNYKLSLTDKESKPENIMGVSEFGIDNQSMFKRFELSIERSQTGTNNLQKNKNPQWRTETLFLRALVTGEANLYQYVDGNISKYFFETKKRPLEQLVYIRYMGNNSSEDGINSFSESIQQNNQFRQQLFNNVNCGMTEKDFKNIEYTKKELINHFTAFNACSGNSGNSVKYDQNDDREYFALRVLVGGYQSKVSISEPHTYYNKSTDIDKTIFKIGLEAEYILPFNKGSWSVLINPTYQKFDPTKSYVGYINNPGFNNDGDPVHYTAKVDYASIEVPIGVRRYFFLNTNARIFANMAYVVDISSGGSIEFTNSEGLANASGKLDIGSRNNFAIGLGYAYKRFSGEIRYNTPRQLAKVLTWDVKYYSVGLNLGYKLF